MTVTVTVRDQETVYWGLDVLKAFNLRFPEKARIDTDCRGTADKERLKRGRATAAREYLI